MTKRRLVTSVVASYALGAAVVFAQENAADTAKLIEVLQLEAGSVVAEVGAGGGELTVALAKHVGPSGRMFTSELGADRIRRLREAVEKSGATNVQVIEGQETHASLADGCCDAIFMRNVYHHFGDPSTMNASFLRALKPGGRVAIIDFPPRNNAATAVPGKRSENPSHGVSAETVANELTAVGFENVRSEERPSRWFIVVGVKPRA